MNPDFTLKIYLELMNTCQRAAYTFLTFEDYLLYKNGHEKIIILRHDVDRKPGNALKMARMENELGINASYYFRITRESFDQKIIKEILTYNHELGYHYEDLAFCNGDLHHAIERFKENLGTLRMLYSVKTISMHGSPLSRFDNRLLWQHYRYRDFDIIGEPYFDLDFHDVLYLTDASRGWNNDRVTLRDKVKSSIDIKPKSTVELIDMFKAERLPDHIMLNIHPHNWSASQSEWWRTYIWQAIKNEVKQFYVR